MLPATVVPGRVSAQWFSPRDSQHPGEEAEPLPSVRSSKASPREVCAGSAVLLYSRMEDGCNESFTDSTTGPPSAEQPDASAAGAVCTGSGAGSCLLESLTVNGRRGRQAVEECTSSAADLGREDFAGLQSQMDALLEEMARMRCDFEVRYTSLSRLVHQQVQGLSDLKASVRQVLHRASSGRPEACVGLVGEHEGCAHLQCDVQAELAPDSAAVAVANAAVAGGSAAPAAAVVVNAMPAVPAFGTELAGMQGPCLPDPAEAMIPRGAATAPVALAPTTLAPPRLIEAEAIPRGAATAPVALSPSTLAPPRSIEAEACQLRARLGRREPSSSAYARTAPGGGAGTPQGGPDCGSARCLGHRDVPLHREGVLHSSGSARCLGQRVVPPPALSLPPRMAYGTASVSSPVRRQSSSPSPGAGPQMRRCWPPVGTYSFDGVSIAGPPPPQSSRGAARFRACSGSPRESLAPHTQPWPSSTRNLEGQTTRL